LRRWWEALLKSSVYQCDDELLALGRPAVEHILDCIEGKAPLDLHQTYMEFRDWGDWPTLGVKVFAKADLGTTLDALVARGWTIRASKSPTGLPVRARCFAAFVRMRAA
jgi:hypothetical protein